MAVDKIVNNINENRHSPKYVYMSKCNLFKIEQIYSIFTNDRARDVFLQTSILFPCTVIFDCKCIVPPAAAAPADAPAAAAADEVAEAAVAADAPLAADKTRIMLKLISTDQQYNVVCRFLHYQLTPPSGKYS